MELLFNICVWYLVWTFVIEPALGVRRQTKAEARQQHEQRKLAEYWMKRSES